MSSSYLENVDEYSSDEYDNAYSYSPRNLSLDEWISENQDALLNVWESIKEQTNYGFLLFDKIKFPDFCEIAYQKSTIFLSIYTPLEIEQEK